METSQNNCFIENVQDLAVKVECQYCKTSMTQKQLANHWRDCSYYYRFTKKFNPGYRCLFCAIYYDEISLMYIHLKRTHPCQIENSVKKFSMEAKKLITVNSKKPGPKSQTRTFKCNICPVEKKNMAQIVLHLKELHPRQTRKISTHYFKQKLCKTNGFSNCFY